MAVGPERRAFMLSRMVGAACSAEVRVGAQADVHGDVQANVYADVQDDVRDAVRDDVRRTGGFKLLSATCALLLLSVSALAQSTTGRILGTLTDQSGAAVAGATVVITDVQRGTSRSLTTDDSGDFAAPDLAPGTYKIHVEARGFKSVERPHVQIEVASDVRADFSLQPGQGGETVTITEDVPLVNTPSATLGGTLSNKEINDLPLNGRNYENLLQLRPGVMRYPG